LTFYIRNNLQYEAAVCHDNMAQVYHSMNEPLPALVAYEEALGVFSSLGMEYDAVICRTNMVGSYAKLENYDKALELIEYCNAFFSANGMEISIAATEMNAANCYMLLGDQTKAFEHLAKARQIYEKRGMEKGLLLCDVNLGQFHARCGDFVKALRCYDLVISGNPKSPPIIWTALAGKSAALEECGRIEEAFPFLEEAIAAIEATRSHIPLGGHRGSFLNSVSDVYYQAIRFCLDRGWNFQALNHVEALKSRTAEEFVRLSSDSPREAERLERSHKRVVEDFSNSLRRPLTEEDTTAYVELFPMKEGLAAFIIRMDISDSLTVSYSDTYNMSRLSSEAVRFLNAEFSVRKTGSATDFKNYLDDLLPQLHNDVFAPLKTHLEGVRRIVFIPFAGFHLLPLHAMYYEDAGRRRYIMDDYLISYLPSLKLGMGRDGFSNGGKGVNHVVHSDPLGGVRLYYSTLEAQTAARLLNTVPVWKVTKTEMIDLARESRIFHYVGRADGFDLLLHAEENRLETERFSLNEFFGSMDFFGADLATLSACYTGLNASSKADEYVGLPGAVLHAGAATAICSLWSVTDLSTTMLMAHMYEDLNNGFGKAESLKRSQIWLRDSTRKKRIAALERMGLKTTKCPSSPVGDASGFVRSSINWEKHLPQDLSHPYYWAGFICTGAP
jgi:CHAT domain-containing protein